MKGVPHPPEVREQVLAMYKDGGTVDEVAAAHGIGRKQVYQWVDQAGIARRRGPRPKGAAVESALQPNRRRMVGGSPDILTEYDGAWVTQPGGVKRWVEAR